MALEQHELRFVSKQQSAPPAIAPPGPSPNTLNRLKATDIVTDVVGISAKVIVNGVECAHIILIKVTNWELNGRDFTIFSEDQVPLVLTFINASEATAGQDRFEIAMNGGTI